MALASKTSYFIAKCFTLESLQQCVATGDWACQDRANSPHPRDILRNACEKGRVVLIFSVNNQRGWHGFCDCIFNDTSTTQCDQIENKNVVQGRKDDITDSIVSHVNNNKSTFEHHEKSDASKENENDVEGGQNIWHHFTVQWKKHFQAFSKQECLRFEQTQHLCLPDGTVINKARNWQEVSADVGEELCRLIEDHYDKLSSIRQKEAEEKLANREESFFKAEENLVDSEVKGGWTAVIEKVERELGKVHLVCPFGSQRYNCALRGSDNDIFIVYQARTTDILGLDPPKQTIKNSESALVDYTVLEIHRYCDLLVSGDPRCIETLFLQGTGVVAKSSAEWEQLCTIRTSLLTRSCFEKYMKEAQGTTGLKQLLKWRDNNPDVVQLTPKLNKLGYIILRLLQSARDMVTKNTLHVYRAMDSIERQELLAVREGSYSISQLIDMIESYTSMINTHAPCISPDRQEAKVQVQDWLLQCRVQNLVQFPHVLTT